MEAPTDLNTHTGQVRTDIYCHECSKNFVALLDHDIDGNHVVECPHCGHEHCRVIKGGSISEDRWNSRYGKVKVARRNVWKHSVLQAQTTSAAEFIRDRWLNFGG